MRRKGFAICLIIGMILTLGSIVVAADSATVALSLSANTVRQGESITVTVNLTGADEAKSALIAPIYDETVLEITGGEWLVSGTMSAYDASKKVALYADTAAGKLHGDVFAMTFRVKENAKSGDTSVSCSVTLKNGTVTLPLTETTPMTFSLKCIHFFGPWKTDGAKHKRVCSICGETETEYHVWDDGTVNLEPTETERGSTTYTCTICRETERREIPELLHVHSFGNAWRWDEASHWRACSCGEKKDVSPHGFGEWMITKEPTMTSEGEKVRTCFCGALEVEQIGKLPTFTTGTAKPTETTGAPAEATTSPAEATTSPAEATTSSAEATTSPAEETVSPAVTTGPMEETLRIETEKNPSSSDGNKALIFVIAAVMLTVALIAAIPVFLNLKGRRR